MPGSQVEVEHKVEKNKPLLDHNTLHLTSEAEYFFEAATIKEIQQIFLQPEYHHLGKHVLGEGSNVVLPEFIEGMVVHPYIKGISITREDVSEALVRVGSGENWDELVQWTIENGLYGLENLSLIPGSAGAAPVQNIGAYGVEFSDVCENVEAYLPDSDRYVRIDNNACEFGYRDSVFKNRLKNKAVISFITLRLSRIPYFNTSYAAIRERVNEDGRNNDLSPEYIRDIVVETRQSKLPDPKQIPNAGSFFKNPVITIDHYYELLKKYPGLVAYNHEEGKKLAAGWLIDTAGWKGYQKENIGVHDKQALVLVNKGEATSTELLSLAGDISKDVFEKFGIELEQEPINF